VPRNLRSQEGKAGHRQRRDARDDVAGGGYVIGTARVSDPSCSGQGGWEQSEQSEDVAVKPFRRFLRFLRSDGNEVLGDRLVFTSA
jgi:hypothetical protein